jgi:hypothetical protein
MEFADLSLNRKVVTVLGVPVTVRLHSVAFRNFATVLTIEGRAFEQHEDEDGRKITKMIDGGSMAQYRRIVHETVKDGVVEWGLHLKDGGVAPVDDATLAFLDEHFPEFVAGVFDEVETFNTPLSSAKKKT